MKRTVLTRISSVRFSNTERSIFSGLLLKNTVDLKSTKVVVVVDIPTENLPVEPAVGQIWDVEGACEEQRIDRDGFYIKEATFKDPKRCELKMPSDTEGLIQFLADDPAFKGIGEVKARQLVERFGSELIRLASSGNRDAFRDILTDSSAESLILGFHRYRNLRHAKWLSAHGVPLSVQKRLFKAHSEESIDLIKDNPYTLITFGIPFSQCETIAESKFGLTSEDPRRLAAAAEQALIDHCSNGHTIAKPADLKVRIGRILSQPEQSLVDQALELVKHAKYVTYREEEDLYHNAALHIMERVAAKRLKRISTTEETLTERQYDTIRRVAIDLPYTLTERQLDAVETCLKNGLSCITGGAGTGKTTVLRTALQCYHLLGYEIKAMALSGRAAMRLRESIGIETMTIASFLRNEQIQDRPTIVVVDEASMLDLNYLYQIVLRTLPSTRILLCGDPHQLPPIGPGIPFSDIIQSKIAANTELDIVQRQESTTGIPEYSLDIRLGRIPAELSVGRIFFHSASRTEEITEKCKVLLNEAPRESKVIAPTLELTKAINVACQESVNPQGEPLMPSIWGDKWATEYRLGDPILFTRNDSDIEVQNGSLGHLISVHQSSDEQFGEIRLDDFGTVVSLGKTVLDNIKLGYGITLHKAQGSQFPRIIIALGNSRLIDRSWIYTAITRSEAEVHIVGSRAFFVESVLRESAHHKRKTFLKELLKEREYSVQRGNCPVIPS